MKHHKIFIIGSGPAGFTAGIYAARAGLEPVMAAGFDHGGQLMTTSEIEHFPGFPEGISAQELMANMEAQAVRFGLKIEELAVESIDLEKRPFELTMDDGSMHSADAIIVATGASARYLGIPGEAEFLGRGVSACATCDGFFFKNKEICVIGGGDSALEEAHFLTRFASKVYLIHRRDSFRASKAMQDRVFSNEKIEILWNSRPVEVKGDKAVKSIVLENTISHERRELSVEGYFCAVGRTPNTLIFKDKLELDVNGYIVTRAPSTETSVDGVFACGDVADPHYRQGIVAAGAGAKAALDAERYLIALAK